MDTEIDTRSMSRDKLGRGLRRGIRGASRSEELEERCAFREKVLKEKVQGWEA